MPAGPLRRGCSPAKAAAAPSCDPAAVTVEWPWARTDAKQALEGLADVQWAAQKAADDSLVPPDYYRDIGNAINVLDDWAGHPEKVIGKVSRDDEEVALIKAVFDAFEIVVAQVVAGGGRVAPNSAFYAASGWPTRRQDRVGGTTEAEQRGRVAASALSLKAGAAACRPSPNRTVAHVGRHIRCAAP